MQNNITYYSYHKRGTKLEYHTGNIMPQDGLVAFVLGFANAPLNLLLIFSALFLLPCGLSQTVHCR